MNNIFRSFIIIVLVLVVSGCSILSKKSSSGGGYYQDDGPGKKQIDISKIPDAKPRKEAYSKAASRPYTVNGKRYFPLESAVGYVAEGQASWYGKKYHGRKTSIGEVYDMYSMTAAHKTLPIPSYVRVTNVANQRSVVVRVNDRGPFIHNRIIDLSYVAAQKLGVVNAGTGQVIVQSVSANDNVSATVQSSPYRFSTQSPVPLPPTKSPPATSAPITSPPAAKAPQSVQSGGFKAPTLDQQWLQIGAFSIVENAQKLTLKLLNQGYDRAQVVQKEGLYKVMIGPYSQEKLNVTYGSLKGRGYSVIRVSE